MTSHLQQHDDELTKLRTRVAEVEQSNATLTAKNAELQKVVAHLQHLLFARKSELAAQRA